MMIEVLAITGIAGAALTLADHENVFQNNPEKKWFWERPPFAPAPPATTPIRRYPQMVVRPAPVPRMMARQEYTALGPQQVGQRLGGSKYVVTA